MVRERYPKIQYWHFRDVLCYADEIPAYALDDKSTLTTFVFPERVTKIGSYAFYGCRSLASITIPNGVTSIGDSAFYGCVGMRYYDFTNHTSVPTLASTYSFYSMPSDCEIRVPAALYDEWISATNWSTYADKIVAV